MRALLNISSVFLAIFLVQLLLYGVHELSEAGVFPASQAIHDATEILGPDGKIGHLLAYALAIVPTVWLAVSWRRRRVAARFGLGRVAKHPRRVAAARAGYRPDRSMASTTASETPASRSSRI